MESPISSLECKSAASFAGSGPAGQLKDAKKWQRSGAERRGRVRVFSQLPLSVKFGGIYESPAEALNISARGMFFALQQRLEIGATIELVFRLPRHVIGVDGIWLRCPAEVVRVQEGLPEGRFGIAAKITGYEIFVR